MKAAPEGHIYVYDAGFCRTVAIKELSNEDSIAELCGEAESESHKCHGDPPSKTSELREEIMRRLGLNG